MSLFQDSASVDSAHVFDKILFWGPPGGGKTHTAMTWPEPVFVDKEGGRALHFRDRFRFGHFAPKDLAQLAQAFKELRSGGAPGKTVVIDSATAIYYDFVMEHTTRSEKGSVVTDWVTVNRRFLACMEFAFGVTDKNVIFTAHQSDKLVRNGKDFSRAGVKFVGDERFRFAFDYIFRIEPQGDPRVKPAKFHVEKSASPNVKIGDVIVGLDYQKFLSLTRGATQNAAPPLKGEVLADAQTRSVAPVSTDAEPILERQAHAIENLRKQLGIGEAQLKTIVRETTGRTADYLATTSQEAALVIKAMGHTKVGAA